MDTPRRMWTLFEPIHVISYFTPEARSHFEAAGLRGFWRGYFAGRAAPLGAVSAAPVTAAFFSFAPHIVARALPDVWTRATPAESLAARLSGATAVLSFGGMQEAADLLMEAASNVDTDGRVLAAANAALPVPSEPAARLWHAATVLREHRGDGHIAALVTAGLDGCMALAWRASIDMDRGWLQPARGWMDDEWAAAEQRLVERDWLVGGAATPAAVAALGEIESTTDKLAARPWARLGPARTERLVELLTPIAEAAYGSIPADNAIGLPGPKVR